MGPGCSTLRSGWRRRCASSIPAEGINLFLANGETAQQEVLHTHLHVVPRTPGDGFTLKADFGNPDRDLLDVQAAAIEAGLRARA
jgi:diadenosine tetraphosphate (Ap4A) HIT family hydrolase